MREISKYSDKMDYASYYICWKEMYAYYAPQLKSIVG